NLPARFQFVNLLRCPGLRVRLGVLDREIILQRVMVDAVDALDNVQSFTMGKAYVIQPRGIVETGCIDNQGVAFPLADRIAIVSEAVKLLGMSPIQMDLPQLVSGFLIHEDL